MPPGLCMLPPQTKHHLVCDWITIRVLHSDTPSFLSLCLPRSALPDWTQHRSAFGIGICESNPSFGFSCVCSFCFIYESVISAHKLLHLWFSSQPPGVREWVALWGWAADGVNHGSRPGWLLLPHGFVGCSFKNCKTRFISSLLSIYSRALSGNT